MSVANVREATWSKGLVNESATLSTAEFGFWRFAVMPVEMGAFKGLSVVVKGGSFRDGFTIGMATSLITGSISVASDSFSGPSDYWGSDVIDSVKTLNKQYGDFTVNRDSLYANAPLGMPTLDVAMYNEGISYINRNELLKW